MKKALIISAAAILTIIIGWRHFLGGRIICDAPVVFSDIAAVSGNGGMASFSHTFALKNYGDDDIEIASATTSCSCTNLVFPKVIPAFGRAELTAQADFPADESFERQIDIVLSNSSKENPFALKMVLTNSRYVSVSPKSLVFGEIARLPDSAGKISVECLSPSDAGITFDFCPDGITAEIKKTSEKERVLGNGIKTKLHSYEIILNFPDKISGKSYCGGISFALKTDFSTSRHTIPISWEKPETDKFSLDKYALTKSLKKTVILLKTNTELSRIKTDNKRFVIGAGKRTDNGIELTAAYTGSENENSSGKITALLADGSEISADIIYIAQ